jgi:hypothetical protein
MLYRGNDSTMSVIDLLSRKVIDFRSLRTTDYLITITLIFLMTDGSYAPPFFIE